MSFFRQVTNTVPNQARQWPEGASTSVIHVGMRVPPLVWTSTCTGNSAMKPYAVWLLERLRAGETASELAEREGIPLDRIQFRLDAATRLERMCNAEPNTYAESRAA